MEQKNLEHFGQQVRAQQDKLDREEKRKLLKQQQETERQKRLALREEVKALEKKDKHYQKLENLLHNLYNKIDTIRKSEKC